MIYNRKGDYLNETDVKSKCFANKRFLLSLNRKRKRKNNCRGRAIT
jgi:hypothetical protein